LSSANRDNRKPFTFWFDKQLKDKLKHRAAQMGTTTTELLNRAVQIYIEKGYVQDDENSAKFGMNLDIAQELGQTSHFESKFSELASQLKGLQARLENVEGHLDDSGQMNQEYIQNQIKIHVQSKVEPIMTALSETISKLDRQTSEI
jgi:hypothetical protein